MEKANWWLWVKRVAGFATGVALWYIAPNAWVKLALVALALAACGTPWAIRRWGPDARGRVVVP